MNLLDDRPHVTDGGLETDLIFHHGVDLPEFAAFPLLEEPWGRTLLEDYFDGYADVARRAGAGLLMETATWRASAVWGERLGYDAAALDRVNRAHVAFLHQRRDVRSDQHDAGVLVGGTIGPHGDGYVAEDALSAEAYADYHLPQLSSFAAADADLATALTLTGPQEAIGVVAAARSVGLPVAISFTVETDGSLPDGTMLREAIETVDAAGGPDWFVVNCAHPAHIAEALVETESGWTDRILGLRPNASRQSHAQLDAAEELDEGHPAQLRADVDGLRDRLPGLLVLGGCCGTDVRHVRALWAREDHPV